MPSDADLASDALEREPSYAPSHGAAQVRNVPSESFPTIAAALAELPGNDDAVGVPAVVVRLAPGEYSEPVKLCGSIVLEGADSTSLPVLDGLGSSGLEVHGHETLCVLRRLHLRAREGCSALSIDGASPLVEECELQGAGGGPARGARAGLVVKGAASRPKIRSCAIWGHSGAGIMFEEGAGGVLSGNEITQCGCGVWVESGAAPLLWQNVARNNSGAGVVARAGAAAQVFGNALANNACGALLESDRKDLVVLAHNRITGNIGPGLRQGKATTLKASEAGAFAFGNALQDNGSGVSFEPSWPRRVVRDAAELVAAMRCAPSDRFSIIEVSGLVQLAEPLVVDRPVLLTGGGDSTAALGAEMRCTSEAPAVIRVARGGEHAVISRLVVRAGPGLGGSHGATSCVRVEAGRPVLLECHFDASLARNCGSSAHAIRIFGSGVAPLCVACVIRGAERAGASVEKGAVATFLRSEVVENFEGISVCESSVALLEECTVRENDGFAIAVASGSKVLLGQSAFRYNGLGGLHLRGHKEGDTLGASAQISLLDRCTVVIPEFKPALAVGGKAAAVSWLSNYIASSSDEHEADVAVVVESGGQAAVSACCSGDAALRFDVGEGGKLEVLDVESSQLPDRDSDDECPSRIALSALTPSATAFAARGRTASVDLLPCGPGPPPLPLSMRRVAESDRSLEGAEHDAGGDDRLSVEELRNRRGSGSSAAWAQAERRSLYRLLAMLAAQAKCPGLTSVVGLGGPICSGEVVHIRAHTGRYVCAKPGGAVACHAPAHSGESEFFVIPNTRAGALQRSDAVTLEVASSGQEHLMLSVDSSSGQACALPAGHPSCEQTLKIVCRAGESVESGSTVSLRAVPSRKLLEVSGEVVRTGGTAPCTRNRFVLEKVPPPAVVPTASPDQDLSIADQAWMLRRGVKLGLVERQSLAVMLSPAAAPAPELLAAFAALWEAEWRSKAFAKRSAATQAEPSSGHGGAQPSGSKAPSMASGGTEGASGATVVETSSVAESAATATSAAVAAVGSAVAAAVPSEREALARIKRLVRGYSDRSPPPELANGDLFVNALRSFFADALQVAQLEANNVQRIVEAFAAALVADAGFLEAFSESMLPEDQRKVYKTPEEILFGLAYTTIMLNTDMHSQQVQQKMWDQRKFVAAGKDCGVQGPLMAQIYKRISENEL